MWLPIGNPEPVADFADSNDTLLCCRRQLPEILPTHSNVKATPGERDAVVGCSRCLTRGCAEALLGARVRAVYAPGISKEWDSSQGAYSVHNQQGSVLLAQLANAFQVLVHSCAAFTLQSYTTSVHSRKCYYEFDDDMVGSRGSPDRQQLTQHLEVYRRLFQQLCMSSHVLQT